LNTNKDQILPANTMLLFFCGAILDLECFSSTGDDYLLPTNKELVRE
jgi:hypothetical protein